MHRQKAEIEAAEHRPETPLSQPLVHHPAGHFREPVEDAADHRKDVDADQHVVDVGDDEVGVGELPVDGRGRGHHARNAADHEQNDHAGVEQERRREHRPPGPDGGGPRQHGDGARNGDDQRSAAEQRQRQVRQARGEHVVHPDAEAEDHGADGRQRHEGVTHQGSATEGGQTVRHHAHGGQHDRVHPRVCGTSRTGAATEAAAPARRRRSAFRTGGPSTAGRRPG